MIVCVTGMHRSGTSMVMSRLHGLGLHVGNHADLMSKTNMFAVILGRRI
jgi:hypothetical protein